MFEKNAVRHNLLSHTLLVTILIVQSIGLTLVLRVAQNFANAICPYQPGGGRSGRALVLIQGLTTGSGGSAAYIAKWKKYTDKLGSIYDNIIYFSYNPDAAEYQASDTFDGIWSSHVPNLNRVLAKCKEVLSTTSFDIIGHSLGGVVAIEYLKQYGSVDGQRGWIWHVITLHSPVNGLADLPSSVAEVVWSNTAVTSDAYSDLRAMYARVNTLASENIAMAKRLAQIGIGIRTWTGSVDAVTLGGPALLDTGVINGFGGPYFLVHRPSDFHSSLLLSDRVADDLVEFLDDEQLPIAEPRPVPTPTRPSQENTSATLISSYEIATVVLGQQRFDATWNVRNSGNTSWDANVKLAFRRGKQMGAPDEVSVPVTQPGTDAGLGIALTAPSEAGDHVGFWQLKRGTTFFGPELKVQVNVRSDAPPPNSGSSITAFDMSPASPSAASSVRLVGRVKKFSDFRSMRFVVGTERFEMTNFKAVGDQYEISTDWNTASLNRGDHTVILEVARIGDSNWSSPIREVKTYTLSGTAAPVNRPPTRPVLQGPYNWYLKDASGASADVQLCVAPASDPEGNEVRYIFDVNNGQVTADYMTQPCWTYTFGPGNYAWRVKTRDPSGAESPWSAETWNFSVANGGVSIGSPYQQVLDPGQTQLCVEVTYGGTQAPEVKGFINTATDGSENGAWRQLDHFGPNAERCNASNVHGFRLYPVNYDTGTHAIKITAHKLDSGASAQRLTSFGVSYMRPAGPNAVAPSSVSNDNTQWNVRSIRFDWDPVARADGYTLRASTTANPFSDPSPVLNVTLGAATTEYTHAFTQDYPTLYWSVRASNSAGDGDSSIARFGIDLVAPTCSVQSLSAVLYNNVIPVQWSGADASSGVRAYDVQVRDTQRGEWLDWLVDTPATLGQFIGQPGHGYEFRCRTRDRAGNIGAFPGSAQASTRVDPSARPPEPWWSASYSAKRDISIQNTMAGVTLPAGYPVVYRVSGTTAAEIYNASQASPKCNDLRVVYNNSTQLDRLVTQCSSSAIEIWFRNQAPIAANGSSSVHQLYFGNPSAGSPPICPRPSGSRRLMATRWRCTTSRKAAAAARLMPAATTAPVPSTRVCNGRLQSSAKDCASIAPTPATAVH